MARIEVAIRDVHLFDRLALNDTPVHRLDPRAKVLVTLAFVVTAVSYPKYEIAELLPLLIYPAAIAAFAEVPWRIIFRYLLAASPFAIMIGIFNPFFDRAIAAHVGQYGVSAGWLSFISIMVRFLLTVSAALLLLAGTGYVSVCSALGRMGAPKLLVTQFLLLYRYIFVLSEEADRMSRARALRSGSQDRAGLRVWSSLVGHLLLRAYDRGTRLYSAMLCRGFDGTISPRRESRWLWRDSFFAFGWCAFFLLARFGHLAQHLGNLTMRMMQ